MLSAITTSRADGRDCRAITWDVDVDVDVDVAVKHGWMFFFLGHRLSCPTVEQFIGAPLTTTAGFSVAYQPLTLTSPTLHLRSAARVRM